MLRYNNSNKYIKIFYNSNKIQHKFTLFNTKTGLHDKSSASADTYYFNSLYRRSKALENMTPSYRNVSYTRYN